MFHIACQNPTFIVNSKIRFLPLGTRLCRDGVYSSLSPADFGSLAEHCSPFSLFSICRPRQLSYDFCERYFFVTPMGEVVDMFVAVPCRRCPACVCSRINSVKQRLLYALQDYRVPPLFVTLTYNDSHLPDGRNVCRSDVQKFLKRLRVLLKRKYDVDNLKYFYVSEYAPGSLRPHYHLVLLGFPVLSKNIACNKILRSSLIQFCWREPDRSLSFHDYRLKYPIVFRRTADYDPRSYGFIDVFDFDNMKSVNYLCKYMFKNTDDAMVTSHVDPVSGRSYERRSRHFRSDGLVRNFTGTSINLGVDFASRHLCGHDVVFTDWLSRRVVQSPLSSYFISKLFPSFSKLFPVSFRRSYYFAIRSIDKLISFHDKFCFSSSYRPFLKSFHRSLVHTRSYLLNNFSFLPYAPSDYTFDKDFIPLGVFDSLVSEIKRSVKDCYEFLISHDISLLLSRCVARDSLVSSFPQLPPRDYSNFILSMNRCLIKQKSLNEKEW